MQDMIFYYALFFKSEKSKIYHRYQTTNRKSQLEEIKKESFQMITMSEIGLQDTISNTF